MWVVDAVNTYLISITRSINTLRTYSCLFLSPFVVICRTYVTLSPHFNRDPPLATSSRRIVCVVEGLAAIGGSRRLLTSLYTQPSPQGARYEKSRPVSISHIRNMGWFGSIAGALSRPGFSNMLKPITISVFKEPILAASYENRGSLGNVESKVDSDLKTLFNSIENKQLSFPLLYCSIAMLNMVCWFLRSNHPEFSHKHLTPSLENFLAGRPWSTLLGLFSHRNMLTMLADLFLFLSLGDILRTSKIISEEV